MKLMNGRHKTFMLKSTHLLKWLLLLFVTAIAVMGLYDFFYVHPSFTALISENTGKRGNPYSNTHAVYAF